MHYFGGKARTCGPIANYLEIVRAGKPYFEPFCGGLWVTAQMTGERHCSDANEALITLYKEVQKGWQPPSVVPEEVYQDYKARQPKDDPMTAFVGIGCSFAGKWFGGYARSDSRNYASNAKNSLLKKMAKCSDVKFSYGDYLTTVSEAPKGSLVYMDPPYAETTGYAATGAFDAGQFWSIVRVLSREYTVVVSEYSAPPDFQTVLEIPTKTDVRTTAGKAPRIEKLFRYAI